MSDQGVVLPSVFGSRSDDSAKKLQSVRGACDALKLSELHPHVTVYVTGSLGRLEGGSHSDLDVFCVDVASDTGARMGKLDSLRLFASLIQVNEAEGFPAFSRDGEFLVVHHVDDVLNFLGTRYDDYRNLFTARMLLLLESQPLVGATAYKALVARVIDLYWRDAKPGAVFKPTFLINDLVRYWKTICLSHEAETEAPNEEYRKRRRADVLKLQFNRLWMVFNGVTYLLHGFGETGVARSHVERLVALSPLERILEIAAQRPETADCIQGLLDEYAWFLDVTDCNKLDRLEFFGNDTNYDEGRTRGAAFGDHMADLVDRVAASTPIQRFLLI